ncbi:hypothetical protein ACP70R_012123 [Stipagrostis hirtigluma subsp. patula]
MPSPPSVTSRTLVAAVLCCVVAIAGASCSGSGDQNGVVSFCFPSFKGVNSSDSRYDLSWDAGVVDGALHLTVDDVHQPPVNYLPDSRRWDGRIILQRSILLSVEPSDGSPSQRASFNTTFTMSVSQRHNQGIVESNGGGGLLFEVLSDVLAMTTRDTYNSLISTTSGNVSVEIGTYNHNGNNRYYEESWISGLYVSITPATTPDAPPAKYTVWIDYDGKGQLLWVYVEDEKKPKPAQATLRALNISGIFPWTSYSYGSHFGLFASKDRSLPSCHPVIYSWNLTVDRLSKPKPRPIPSIRMEDARRWGIGKEWFLAIVVSSVLVAAVAAAVATVLIFRRHGAAVTAMVSAAAFGLVLRYQALRMKMKLSRALRRLPGIPREFKYADVKKATRNFHESMRLGTGGFGAVYKGTLLISATGDGQDGPRERRRVDVAVKKFTRKEDRGYEDFLAEVAVINRLRHKNIVPLLGWCFENGKLLLIYQYMPNGSLDQHIFRDNSHQHLPTLRLEARYDIVRDVAAGLHYVHHEYERVVLHRDIKASNIMVDEAFHGRLGDFGLARVVGFNRNSITDIGVAGTWGFIAPEYAVSHKATRQTDVYAFGVLVVEIVTGRRSLSAADAPFPLLTDWVWWLHGEGRLLEAVDDVLTAEAEFDAGDATRLLLLGLACCNPKPSDRPSMAEVVQVMAKAMPPPDVPLAKPTFLWPPEGELELLSDSDDDFAGTGRGDSDWSHAEEIRSQGGFVISIGSLEITMGRSRKVRTR